MFPTSQPERSLNHKSTLPPTTKHPAPGIRAMVRLYVYQRPKKGKPGSGAYVYDREGTRRMGRFSVKDEGALERVVEAISRLIPKG